MKRGVRITVTNGRRTARHTLTPGEVERQAVRLLKTLVDLMGETSSDRGVLSVTWEGALERPGLAEQLKESIPKRRRS